MASISGDTGVTPTMEALAVKLQRRRPTSAEKAVQGKRQLTSPPVCDRRMSIANQRPRINTPP